MGIGLHGGSKNMIKWLLEEGAQVVATDIKKEVDLKKTLDELRVFKNLEVVTGHHRPEDFKKADLVIKNPTVPWSNKYIQIAVKNNTPIEMDSSIFMEYCKSKKIIGITGTKGKTTTASLINQILIDAGEKTAKVGIGQEAVMDKLKKINPKTFVVFEMSSWRLSGLQKNKISPRYSLVTNIYPDHLNHYDSMEAYIKDKKQVYIDQSPDDFIVLNYDNKITREMAMDAPGQVVFFSDKEIDGDNVVFVRDGKIISRFDDWEKEVCELKSFALKGAHNLHNILGAIAMVLALGVDLKRIKKTLSNFKGVVHRLELVRSLKGVDFYNDTTATTPEAAIAGVNSFMKPVNLIMGGSSKKLNPDKFLEKISKASQVKNIFILESKISEEIKEKIIQFGGEDKIQGVYSEFDKAIESAYSGSSKGDVVLLSPGFASFGMFQNEFDRGRQFRTIVNGL